MGLIDLLFPKYCLECGANGQYVCESCVDKVRPARHFCAACSKRAVDGMTHATCKKKLHIDGIYSVFEYEGVVRKAILSFKYKFAHDLSHELCNHMLNRFSDSITPVPTGDVLLVPVPMHRRRKKERGFNQAELMGKEVAGKMNWRYVPDLLIREEFRRPQAELKGEERKKNIHGAFSYNFKYKTLDIGRRPIIIFDDVATTGSTLKEAAKVMKRNGGGNVWGLTVAG